jgi:hypothetical protein
MEKIIQEIYKSIQALQNEVSTMRDKQTYFEHTLKSHKSCWTEWLEELLDMRWRMMHKLGITKIQAEKIMIEMLVENVPSETEFLNQTIQKCQSEGRWYFNPRAWPEHAAKWKPKIVEPRNGEPEDETP